MASCPIISWQIDGETMQTVIEFSWASKLLWMVDCSHEIKRHLLLGRHFLLKASLVAQIVRNPPVSAGDPGSIPGLGKFPGEGNGYSLQYFCLKNSKDRGAWWAIVHGITKSWTLLSD